jgi:tetratricopeptide (TPR) repeat protein
MSIRGISISIAIVGLVSCCLPAYAGDDPAARFAEGKALLAKGDFDAALAAYAAAAKADPKSEQFRQDHALLRRIIKMRQDVREEKDAKKFEATALALRVFYYDNALFREALGLDQQVLDKLQTVDAAARLAETQLQLDMNAEAAEVLASVPDTDSTPQTEILSGIALARQNRIADAKVMAQKCPKPDQLGPGLLFDLARLHALIGNRDKAVGVLIQCFESTPPSRLEGFKAYAKTCKDLGSLVASAAEFDAVMRTQSKVKESACSSGADCGKCPSKSSCSGGKTKADEKAQPKK